MPTNNKSSNNVTIGLMRVVPLKKLGIGALVLLLTGCVGPPALHESVLGYDQTTAELEQEILLLNIARLSQEAPVHFTVTGSIAATFDFTTSGNVGGNIAPTPSPFANSFNFGWSASASENPTFSIVPLSGEAFTKRIINPLSEDAFAKLGYQDISIAIIMRLMASSVLIKDKKDNHYVGFMRNDAKQSDEYAAFRRFVMHLESIQMKHQLFVNNLVFDKVILDNIKEPWNKNPMNLANAVDNGMHWRHNNDGTYTIMKRTVGRVLISNYDPRLLADEELNALNEIANRHPNNYVLTDIRKGHPGGKFPLFGVIKLRSLYHILLYVSHGAGDRQKDLHIEINPDPRTTGKIEYNPRQTLAINVSDDAPSDDVLYIQYKNRYYSIGDSPWDRTAFMILNGLFQFTVTDVSDIGIPITISK